MKRTLSEPRLFTAQRGWHHRTDLVREAKQRFGDGAPLCRRHRCQTWLLFVHKRWGQWLLTWRCSVNPFCDDTEQRWWFGRKRSERTVRSY